MSVNKRSIVAFLLGGLVGGLIAACLSFFAGMISAYYEFYPYKELRKAMQEKNADYSVYHKHKKSFFDIHGNTYFDVVFIGDSITDGAEWSELFPGFNIANRGVAGDRTDALLNRMDAVLSTNAKRAFLMIGVNDFFFGKSVEDVTNNYEQILNQLIEQNMEVIIQSTLYTGVSRQSQNEKIAKLNRWLENKAATRAELSFIDLNASLSKNGVLNPAYSSDDVHLNGEGYAVWKDRIKNYFD